MTRLTGHALWSEGAAHTEDRRRITWNTTAGRGHGVCECGGVSEELPSAVARRAWHKAHKAQVRAGTAATSSVGG